MGFPLSTFQQLSRLCKDEPSIRRAFSGFRLVSIIVHHPADTGFRTVIQDGFEYLHEVTGEGFAFISFINPPRRWAADHALWMDLRERLSAGDGLEASGIADALRQRLDLPGGPCLLLTDDLLADRYIVLPTSCERIIGQMEAIGGYVRAHPQRFPVDSQAFLSFLEGLGPAFAGKTPDGKALAKNIADLVAVPALTGAGAPNDRASRQRQRKEAHDYVKAELHSLWARLEENREAGDADLSEELLNRFSDYYFLVLRTAAWDYSHDGPRSRHCFPGGDRDSCQYPPAQRPPYGEYLVEGTDVDRLEPLSRTYLSDYNRLLPLYLGREPFGRHRFVDLEALSPEGLCQDFSPLGLNLGKVVEEEMNASLVQRIRQLKGVHMPEFYRRFEEALGDRCKIRTRQKAIYLNWPGRRLSATDCADRPLSMGELVCVLRAMTAEEGQAALMGRFCADAYIERVDRFAELRNAACHAGLFGREEYNQLFQAFQQLRAQDFPELCTLKDSLRSPRYF